MKLINVKNHRNLWSGHGISLIINVILVNQIGNKPTWAVDL